MAASPLNVNRDMHLSTHLYTRRTYCHGQREEEHGVRAREEAITICTYKFDIFIWKGRLSTWTVGVTNAFRVSQEAVQELLCFSRYACLCRNTSFQYLNGTGWEVYRVGLEMRATESDLHDEHLTRKPIVGACVSVL